MSGLSSPLVSLDSNGSTRRSNNQSSFAIPGTPVQRGALRRRHQPATPSSTSHSREGQHQPIRRPGTSSSSANSSFNQSIEPSLDPINQPPREELWGTTIDVNQVRISISTFLDNFRLESFNQTMDQSTDQSNQESPHYIQLLKDAILSATYCLDLDCQHLLHSDPELHHQLVAWPSDILPLFDSEVELRRSKCIDELFAEIGSDLDLADDPSRMYVVRPFNLGIELVRSMRSLDPEDIDSMIALKGLVIRCSALIPEMKQAYFVCSRCNHGQESPIEDGEIIEPSQCLNAACAMKHSYRLVHNRCLFIDKQIIKLQETPDAIPEGETPHSVSVHVYNELVDSCQPGDRVEMTGIFRALAARVNPRQTSLQTIYRTHCDGLHISIQDQRHNSDSTQAEQNEMLEAQIKEIASDPRVYERLVASLAPSIWEMDDVKKGILCLMFGGAGANDGAGSGRFRGEINVLMCGDPGTSKSQLLQYVNKLAPRGIYTSGKGSSAVGLTASVMRDPETREMVLESGALVLSDRGVCCIDEFDKMSDSTRSILHEVMEQQTVSIAKAGIVCSLNARTSILASANPKESRYNPRLSVVENIQIMPTLLSRFDLIYLILDQPNLQKDRKLARHLVQMYFKPGTQAENTSTAQPLELIPQKVLTAYIAYARKHVRPVISENARDLLIEAYQSLRRVGQLGANKVVTATPRQLEALIRISEALARMKLQTVVQAEHVQEARRLMNVATASAATDPATGRIDMDLLMTGHSANERSRDREAREFIVRAIEAMSADTTNIRVNRLAEQANQMQQASGQPGTITEEQTRKIVSDLVHETIVLYVGKGHDSIRKV